MGYVSLFEDINNRLLEFSHKLDDGIKSNIVSVKSFTKLKKDSDSLFQRIQLFKK